MNKLIVLSICAVLSASCSDQASSSNRVVASAEVFAATQSLHNAIHRNDLEGVRIALESGASLDKVYPKPKVEKLEAKIFPAIFEIYRTIRDKRFVSIEIIELVLSKYSRPDLERIVNRDYRWRPFAVANFVTDLLTIHQYFYFRDRPGYVIKVCDLVRPYLKQ